MARSPRPSLTWSDDKRAGRYTLLQDKKYPLAVLIEGSDKSWVGYLAMSPLQHLAGPDLKAAKRFMKDLAERTLRNGPPQFGGREIPAAESIKALAELLGEMSRALSDAADAGGGPEAVAAAPVAIGPLFRLLETVGETGLLDKVKEARLLAATMVLQQAKIERQHRDKPWSDWIVSGTLSFGLGSLDGPRKDFAVVTARSDLEAIYAVSDIHTAPDTCKYSPRPEVKRINGTRGFKTLAAQEATADQDVSQLPRLDLREPWRWPWHTAERRA